MVPTSITEGVPDNFPLIELRLANGISTGIK